jgi:two-component system chemotaxis response regulator CheB
VGQAKQNQLLRDIIVVGGSSGALHALEFIGHLPSELPAAVFVVLHVAPGGPGLLPDIIRRYSKLPVDHASDGEGIAAGHIYVAPPDHHLSFSDDFMQVARGPKENRHRPSVDVLFRSAAKSYGPRVIGVVLSGMLDDGSAGLLEIRRRGGIGIVQDPKDALFPEMPSNALAHGGADYCVPQSQLAGLLTRAALQPIAKEEAFETAGTGSGEAGGSEVVKNDNEQYDKPGTPSDFSCPDCGGVLRQIDDNKMLRFRCRVGHGLSGSTLLAAQSDNVEQALWSALRALEEKAEMARKLKDYSLSRNFKSAPKKFNEEARKLEANASVIRKLLKNTRGSEAPEPMAQDVATAE